MKTRPLNSFLKFYVMTSPGIDLYGIAHVKVDFIPLQKMYVILILGRFVWTTNFVQCDPFPLQVMYDVTSAKKATIPPFLLPQAIGGAYQILTGRGWKV